MRLGILGGTFDPIHFGHLRLAEEMCEEFNLSKVLLITGAQPPHKDEMRITPFSDRHEMTRIASSYSEYLEASDIEGQRKGPSYSIETIRIIRNNYGSGLELFFILGSDAFREITTWKEYKNLLQITDFIVIERPGMPQWELNSFIKSLGSGFREDDSGETYINPYGTHIYIQKTTLMDISSTRIRQNIRAGRSINFMVPDRVKEYIIEKGLYK